MALSVVQVEESEGIHTITLNRPERRNALNPAMIAELTEALAHSEHCNCGVVILTGAGPAFCAGMDIEWLKVTIGLAPEDQRAELENFLWLIRRLYELKKPTIAAVNGAAVAGGTGLALQCDFTLAVPGAKFGYPEVKIGFIPAVVSVFLVAMVGEKQARNLLLSGRLFTSEEALALGLVSEVAPERELIPRARSLAKTLLRNSPQSMKAIKQLLSGFSDARLDRELQRALDWSEKIRNTADFREGIQAFLEKRDPVWPRGKRAPLTCPTTLYWSRLGVSMKLLNFLVEAFISTFGITRPKPEQQRTVALVLGGFLLCSIAGVVGLLLWMLFGTHG